jgi:uncharacterized protein YneF (UPF0154 family)
MKKAIADRPWIWIVIGYLFLMSGAIAGLVISIKHAPQEIALPANPHGH